MIQNDLFYISWNEKNDKFKSYFININLNQ
jgi:hypothetical protein